MVFFFQLWIVFRGIINFTYIGHAFIEFWFYLSSWAFGCYYFEFCRLYMYFVVNVALLYTTRFLCPHFYGEGEEFTFPLSGRTRIICWVQGTIGISNFYSFCSLLGYLNSCWVQITTKLQRKYPTSTLATKLDVGAIW